MILSLVNRRNRVGLVDISQGGIYGTLVDPKVVLAIALKADGSSTKTELVSKDGEAVIYFSVNGTIGGYAHTHYRELLSIFSVSDICNSCSL